MIDYGTFSAVMPYPDQQPVEFFQKLETKFRKRIKKSTLYAEIQVVVHSLDQDKNPKEEGVKMGP